MFKNKYLKYKNKYIKLKEINNIMKGGVEPIVKDLEEHDYDLLIDLYDIIISTKTGSDGKEYKIIGPEIQKGQPGCNEKNEQYLRHNLMAGMKHKDGPMVKGVSSKSPTGEGVHAEPVAASAAYLEDPTASSWISIACLVVPEEGKIQIKVKSSCGICREFLRYHYPNIYVITPDPTASLDALSIPTIDIIPDEPIDERRQRIKDYIKNQLGLKKVKSIYLLPFPYVNSELCDFSKWDRNISITYNQS